MVFSQGCHPHRPRATLRPFVSLRGCEEIERGAAASVAAPRLDCCRPRFPGLAPWATCCRRSAAVPRTFSQAHSACLRFAHATTAIILSSERSERPARATSRGAATACSPAREGVLPNCAHVEYAVSQAHGESCPPVDRFGCARQSPVFAAKLEAIARDGVGQHTRERWDTNRTEKEPRSGDRGCPPRLDF